MRARGSALMLVLLVMALIAVVGFAMGDLCVVNLNMSRQYLLGSRSTLLAQGAVQQFLVVFDQACRRARANGLQLDRSEGVDLGLRDLYASEEGLPARQLDGLQGEVRITFDASQPYHSTDNSLNEYAAAGWTDRATATRSVPPFSVDLIVSVQLDGTTRHYEALITRRWPFAVFVPRGLILVCGTPVVDDAGNAGVVAPSTIEGRVATLEKNPPSASLTVSPACGFSLVGQSGTTGFYNPLLPPDHPDQAQNLNDIGNANINQLVAMETARLDAHADAAVTIGPPITMRLTETAPTPTPPPIDLGTPSPEADIDITSVTTASPSPSPGGEVMTGLLPDPGNQVEGDAYVPASFRPTDGPRPVRPVHAFADNGFSGQIRYDALPDGIDDKNNPLVDVRVPSAQEDTRLPIFAPPPSLGLNLGVPGGGDPNRPTGAPTPLSAASVSLLTGTLTLDPDLADDPSHLQFGNQHTHFVYEGNLGNRLVVAQRARPSPGHATSEQGVAGFMVYEASGGLRLRNSILHVRGNLDLSARHRPGREVGIEGSNSVLIVDGTLALGGGHLDSRDQGMVILARDVVLRARGDYRGLIIATRSLAILPASDDGKPDSMLAIRGGVLSGNEGSNLVLRSVNITYDPVYMKVLHGYGAATCTMWRELP